MHKVFSAVLNGENAATKNSHRPKLTVCGNFVYIGRRRSEGRLPPGGSWVCYNTKCNTIVK